jgi:hypothetical protein
MGRKRPKRKLADSEIVPGDHIHPTNPFLRRERVKKKGVAKANRLEAWKAVKVAKAKGELRQKECEVGYRGCKRWPTEAHHLAYTEGERLNVVWVCLSCHNLITTIRNVKNYAKKKNREG